MFPGLERPETGYIRVMIATLPPSLRGLMVAGFAAAYMSTIATQLNWGASYLVNDFYRRFWKPNASASHYVGASQAATVLLTIISAIVTFYLDSIAGAWKLLLVTGAGTGSVLLLRWYWWRVNAWSEVSAMIAAFVVSLTLQDLQALFEMRESIEGMACRLAALRINAEELAFLEACLERDAALPEVACTVWSNLDMVANLSEGEWLLIHGGGLQGRRSVG